MLFLLSPKLSELIFNKTGQFSRLKKQGKTDVLKEIQNFDFVASFFFPAIINHQMIITNIVKLILQ